MALQGLGVVGALVAEELPEPRGRGLDQHRPVVVPGLVPQVAEHRAVRLGQLHAQGLAVRVVALGQVDRDDAVGVPGGDRLLRRRQQVERQAVGGQAQVVELVDQPPLGRLGVGERGQGVDVGVRGPGAGERARAAEQAGRVHQPVAARHLGVGAADVPVHRDQLPSRAAVPQLRAAVQAGRVLEEDQVSADGAGEGPHAAFYPDPRGSCRRRRPSHSPWNRRRSRPSTAACPRSSPATARCAHGCSSSPGGRQVMPSWANRRRVVAASSAGGVRSSSAASSGGHTSSMAEGCHTPYRQSG